MLLEACGLKGASLRLDMTGRAWPKINAIASKRGHAGNFGVYFFFICLWSWRGQQSWHL